MDIDMDLDEYVYWYIYCMKFDGNSDIYRYENRIEYGYEYRYGSRYEYGYGKVSFKERSDLDSDINTKI